MKQITKKKWTFMVYLAGDNSLASAGLVDLKEMKKVGSTDQINVVAQFDNGKGHRTVRYVLTKGGSLEKDAVKSLGKTNTGDPAVLTAFVDWAVTQYPAEHYVLVVWNHGNGWDDEDLYRSARGLGFSPVRRGTVIHGSGRKRVTIDHLRTLGQNRWRRALFADSLESAIGERGIAYDDDARDFLDNSEMKKVLAGVQNKLGNKLDVLGMDACLMSMVEVIYELRDSISYSVGSEETEPGDGWPYDTILQELAAKPGMTPRDLSVTIVRKYMDSYSPKENVTQAACAVASLPAVVQALDALSQSLTQGLADLAGRAAILQARVQAQVYERTDYVDLADFCLLLSRDGSVPQFPGPCQKVVQAVGKAVVQQGGAGARKDNSHGLSVYFPMKNVSDLYGALDFSKACKWDEFLAAFQNATRGTRPS